MGFGWILSLVSAIPYVVSGIQAIHGDAVAGATKKKLALEALGLAGNTAVGTLTGTNQQYAAAATNLASTLIDNFVGAFKATGSFNFTPVVPAPVAVPAPPPAPVTGAPVTGN